MRQPAQHPFFFDGHHTFQSLDDAISGNLEVFPDDPDALMLSLKSKYATPSSPSYALNDSRHTHRMYSNWIIDSGATSHMTALFQLDQQHSFHRIHSTLSTGSTTLFPLDPQHSFHWIHNTLSTGSTALFPLDPQHSFQWIHNTLSTGSTAT
eukprot:gene29612-biopygen11525